MNPVNGKPESKAKSHGFCGTKFYKLWRGLIARCYYQTGRDYPRYGGRGITVCAEWRNDPTEFIRWCEGQNPEKGLTLDRRDNNGGYSPTNCHFTTSAKQTRNRRSNVWVTHNNEHLVLQDFFDKYAVVSRPTFNHRVYKAGWPHVRAALTPVSR